MTIWSPVMFRNEFDMLRMRIEECEGFQVQHLAVEALWTHRAVPKPLLLARWLEQDHNRDWAKAHRLEALSCDFDPDPHAPWVNEHAQRNRAWTWIDRHAAADDWVLICDVDEIPSRELLSWLDAGAPGYVPVVSVHMRTFLFAVDWEVSKPVPPTCVAARVSKLRRLAANGEYLAEARDGRDNYQQAPVPGGWHFSWCGGPADQAEKLDTATCHTEILATEEAALIRGGRRWATEANGGGLPVRPVTVDRSWPRYIAEGRCPKEWLRPKQPAGSRM